MWYKYWQIFSSTFFIITSTSIVLYHKIYIFAWFWSDLLFEDHRVYIVHATWFISWPPWLHLHLGLLMNVVRARQAASITFSIPPWDRISPLPYTSGVIWRSDRINSLSYNANEEFIFLARRKLIVLIARKMWGDLLPNPLKFRPISAIRFYFDRSFCNSFWLHLSV